MKLRVLSCVLSGLLVSAASAFAQQGTTEIRGKVVDAQAAAVPGAMVVVKNQNTGMFRETVSAADGTYFVGGIVPGTYEVTAELPGIQEARAQGHSPRDRQDYDARSATRRGRHRGSSDRVDRVAARRRDDEGSRRQHHRRRARRPSVDQSQFHRLHRTSSGNRAQHQHRVVRLGFHLGQRRGLAQQQLHAGWRQQQR